MLPGMPTATYCFCVCYVPYYNRIMGVIESHSRHASQMALPWLLAGMLLGIMMGMTSCTPLPTPPMRVVISADGQRQVLETQATSVRALLSEANITVVGLDRVDPPETAGVYDGLTVTVTRVLERVETITTTLSFRRQTVRDATLPESETRLLQVGQPGLREQIYRNVWENGVLTERTLVKDDVIRDAQDEILLVGQRPEIAIAQVLTGTLVTLEQQDAWLLRGSTAARRQLTAFGDLDGRVFTLSPDGKRLLFSRVTTQAEKDHFNALWIVSTARAGDKAVELEIYDVLWADWGPNNQNFAWTTAEVNDRPPGWRGQNDLWTGIFTTKDVLVGKQQILKPEPGGGFGWWGTRYQWSPTGNAIAYARPDEVGIVDIRERAMRPLLRFAPFRTYSSWAWNPVLAWSPDGTFIATAIHGQSPSTADDEDSPVFDLWLLEATEAYSMQVASEVGMWTMPVFSPDGETLLFGRSTLPFQSHISTYNLCTMDRDGSNVDCVFPIEGEPAIQVPGWWWSPDQAAFAFIYGGNLHLLKIGERFSVPITSGGTIATLDWQ